MEKQNIIQWRYSPDHITLNKIKKRKKLIVIFIFIAGIYLTFFGTAGDFGCGLLCKYQGSYNSSAFIISAIITFLFFIILSAILNRVLRYRERIFIITDKYLEIKSVNTEKSKKYYWEQFSVFSNNLKTLTKEKVEIEHPQNMESKTLYLKLKKSSVLGLINYVAININNDKYNQVYQALKKNIK